MIRFRSIMARVEGWLWLPLLAVAFAVWYALAFVCGHSLSRELREIKEACE